MDLLPLRDYQTLLHQAQFVVLPLMDLPHAAGDSHIVQSMSAGKAIIASRTPSPEAYIKPGVSGMLVPPNDVDALREAILRLWQNPDEAAQMGRAARRQYEDNYTFEKVGLRVQEILQKVSNGQTAH
jgi:glycosyltransferase involved in cell wall biosynthesis